MESPSESLELSDIKRLWMVLHGMYGNPLLDKWRTGKVNGNGEDLGILSAQSVWLATLQRHSREVLKRAAALCRERHKTWPPTLPEFDDLCRSIRPTEYVRAAPPDRRIGMSAEYAKKLREDFSREFAALKAKRAGEREHVEGGLPGLLALCAAAVGAAGDDETAWLMQAEREFARSMA